MKAILCLDSDNGMMFNHRRQSRDQAIILDIEKTVGNKILWIFPYSKTLFVDSKLKMLCVSDNAYGDANINDYIFVEEIDPIDFSEIIDTLVIYRWNRSYPSDIKCTISFDKNGWIKTDTVEFVGKAHDKITKDTYVKKNVRR